MKQKLNETEIAFMTLSVTTQLKMIIAGSDALVCKQIHTNWLECPMLLLFFPPGLIAFTLG